MTHFLCWLGNLIQDLYFLSFLLSSGLCNLHYKLLKTIIMTTLKPRLCYALYSIGIKAILNGTLIYTSKNPKTLVSTNTLLVLEVTTRKGYLRIDTVTEVTYNLFYWDFRQNPEQTGKNLQRPVSDQPGIFQLRGSSFCFTICFILAYTQSQLVACCIPLSCKIWECIQKLYCKSVKQVLCINQ